MRCGVSVAEELDPKFSGPELCSGFLGKLENICTADKNQGI
jgi:hypothetical protein